MKNNIKEILITTALSLVVSGNIEAMDTSKKAMESMTIEQLLNSANTEADQAKSSTDKTRNALIELAERLKKKNSEHGKLQSNHSALTKENRVLRQQLEAAENEKNRLKSENESLVSKLDILESEITDLDSQHKALVEAKRKLEASHKATEKDKDALDAKIKAIQKEKEELQ